MYRFVKFKLIDSKYDVTSLINALNIKNRKKRTEFIYYLVCNQIDMFYIEKICVILKIINVVFNES